MNSIYKTLLLFGALLSLLITSCVSPEVFGQKEGIEYTITVKNTLPGERLANIFAVGDPDNSKIWVGDYVSTEARTQFTTGNPKDLANVLGGDRSIVGKIKVDGSLTFKFRTTASTVLITSMVHPDKTPDNYIAALVSLQGKGTNQTVVSKRFDIGDDEDRKTVVEVGPAGSVTVKAD